MAGAALPRDLPAGLPSFDDEPSTEAIISGEPDGRPTIGLVLKRTYRLGARGGWEPVDDADQEIVLEEELDYYEAEPPFCAPPAFGNDVLFRPMTDVVVQGSAWTSGRNVRRTTVRFRMEGLRRDITVHGDRRVERGPTGELRFSGAEPFESMPLRYDRAYGGVDLRAYLLNRTPAHAELERALPGMPFAQASPYHYPRNPAGVGFVLETAPYDPDDLLVPNLEYELDPVTTDRLAVGAPERWPHAPLPAGMDWSSAAWFPRQAYLGVHGLPRGYAGPLEERRLGWVRPDLLDLPLAIGGSGAAVPPAYAQGASPGMSLPLELPTIRGGIAVKLVNMTPDRHELAMVLPREWPTARLGLGGAAMTDLSPALSAIVIRPAEAEVVMLWCASTARERDYLPGQFAAMTTDVAWRRDPR